MMSRLAAFLTAILLASPAAHAVVIDFEALLPTGSDAVYLPSYTEDGFVITSSVDPIFADQAFAAWGAEAPEFNGSVALFNSFEGTVTRLQSVDGSEFSIRSIVLGPAFADAGSGGGIVFTGRRQDGSTVTAGFTLGTDLAPGTYTFGSAFTGLVVLSWEQGVPFHQFDDIVLNAPAVPEPRTAALVAAGLVLCALAARSQRRPARARRLWSSRNTW